MSVWLSKRNLCDRITVALKALGYPAPELDSTSETEALQMIAEALEAEAEKPRPKMALRELARP